jgi:hypothetical protein
MRTIMRLVGIKDAVEESECFIARASILWDTERAISKVDSPIRVRWARHEWERLFELMDMIFEGEEDSILIEERDPVFPWFPDYIIFD